MIRGLVRRPFIRLDRALYDWRMNRRPASGASERVLGLDLFVPPTVLSPRLFKTGPCLARALVPFVRPGLRVLDVGTGSGIVALYAAKLGAQAFAVDLNIAAVRAAQVNAMLNGLDLEVFEGDLFSPVAHETFDIVTFNPPFFERVQGGGLALALADGPGLPTLARFAADLRDVLAPDGLALVVGSSNGALEVMRSHYTSWDLETVRIEERGAERLVVDCLRHR